MKLLSASRAAILDGTDFVGELGIFSCDEERGLVLTELTELNSCEWLGNVRGAFAGRFRKRIHLRRRT